MSSSKQFHSNATYFLCSYNKQKSRLSKNLARLESEILVSMVPYVELKKTEQLVNHTGFTFLGNGFHMNASKYHFREIIIIYSLHICFPLKTSKLKTCGTNKTNYPVSCVERVEGPGTFFCMSFFFILWGVYCCFVDVF